MTFRELEKILIKNGWYCERTRGSHCIYKHSIKLRKCGNT